LLKFAAFWLPLLSFSTANADPMRLSLSGEVWGHQVHEVLDVSSGFSPQDLFLFAMGAGNSPGVSYVEPDSTLGEHAYDVVYRWNARYDLVATLSGLGADKTGTASVKLSAPIVGDVRRELGEPGLSGGVNGIAHATDLSFTPGILLGSVPEWFTGLITNLHATIIDSSQLDVKVDLSSGSPQEVRVPEPSTLAIFVAVASVGLGIHRKSMNIRP